MSTLFAVHEDAQPAHAPQNWKLTLAYDGAGFRGWQVQPGERTIQGELRAAIQRVTGEAPLPQGSGRTDAGVHALGQVASVVLSAPIPPGNLQRAVNRTLPPEIRILEAKTMPGAFHARHSAVAKTYEYRLFLGEICPPFLAPYVFACHWRLDRAAMEAAARVFLGEHNFLSFAATDPDLTTRNLLSAPQVEQALKVPPGSPVRTIFESAWEDCGGEAGQTLVYRVRGNGFLHHMVRNLVGTMIDVGRGQLSVASLPGILAARCRSVSGPTAPARGLFLHSVEYDGQE